MIGPYVSIVTGETVICAMISTEDINIYMSPPCHPTSWLYNLAILVTFESVDKLPPLLSFYVPT